MVRPVHPDDKPIESGEARHATIVEARSAEVKRREKADPPAGE
jgi:hypothetical protein